MRSIAPALKGLSVNVLNRDDRLAIQNTSGRTVVVQGYSHDPYLRLGGDGSVAVNTRSPAYYLNNDRYANAKVPASAKAGAAPQWKPVSKTGRYEWHDHRMHYMGTGRPAKIKDPSVRQTVFDWAVPVDRGRRAARAINGRLLWTPREEPGLPLGAIFALAALVIAGCIVVVVVRLRGRRLEGSVVKRALALAAVLLAVARPPPSPTRPWRRPRRRAARGSTPCRGRSCCASTSRWRRASARCACSTSAGARCRRASRSAPAATRAGSR